MVITDIENDKVERDNNCIDYRYAHKALIVSGACSKHTSQAPVGRIDVQTNRTMVITMKLNTIVSCFAVQVRFH